MVSRSALLHGVGFYYLLSTIANAAVANEEFDAMGPNKKEKESDLLTGGVIVKEKGVLSRCWICASFQVCGGKTSRKSLKGRITGVFVPSVFIPDFDKQRKVLSREKLFPH